MPREIKDLQKLIEERASQELLKDLLELSKTMDAQTLLNVDSDGPILAYDRKQDRNIPAWEPSYTFDLYNFSVQYGMSASNLSPFMRQLYDHWLPKYIEAKSKEFLEKLDQVQQDVNYLLDNQPLQ